MRSPRSLANAAAVASFAAVVLALPAAARAQQAPTDGSSCASPNDHVLTVDGHGKVRVRPDAMRARIGVEAQAKTPGEAQDGTSATARKVVSAMRELRIPGLEVRTEDVNLSPVYATTSAPGESPAIVGYRASNTVEVTVPATPDTLGDVAGRVLEAAQGAGATDMGSMETYLVDESGAQQRALAAAFADAERRARSLAQAAELTLTGVESVDVGPSTTPVPREVHAMMGAARPESGVAPPIEGGERDVTVAITARFTFAPAKRAE